MRKKNKVIGRAKVINNRKKVLYWAQGCSQPGQSTLGFFCKEKMKEFLTPL